MDAPCVAPLSCSIVGDLLMISIGIDTLAHATVTECLVRDSGIPVGITILDKHEFARDVARAINAEREDGSTLLTDLLDKAAVMAFEDGSLGVSYRDPWETMSIGGGSVAD